MRAQRIYGSGVTSCPIIYSIAELPDEFKYIKISIGKIKASAEHANSVADAVITRTTSIEKRTTLELALQECKNEQNTLHEETTNGDAFTQR